MKIDLGPTVKEFVTYLFNIFPCILISMLFFCAIRCYSYDNALVLVPIIACLVVLYTFFKDVDENNTE